MKKIKFENAEIIKPAKVNIDGIEYEVTPAQLTVIENYLSAETLNQMQDNMEEVGVIASPTEPTTNEKIWIQKGKNLLSGIIEGYEFLNTNSGTINANSEWFVTEYIPVNGGEKYSASGFSTYNKWWFDENKNFISYTEDYTAIAPTNAKYLRMNGRISSSSNMIVAQQDTILEYEPYMENTIHVKNENGVFEKFVNVRDTGWITLEDYTTETDGWRGKIHARRCGNLVQIKASCYPLNALSVNAFGSIFFNTLPETFKPLELVRGSTYAKDGSNNIINNLCVSITEDGEFSLDNTSGQDITSIAYFAFNATYFVD